MSKYKFSTPWESDYWMASNGFYCGFNMPKAKTGKDMNSLPEYAWRKAFLTEDYPACPSNWMRSEGRMASYFVGVQKDNGMWLDFNKNASHKYDVAIVISVQGVNPITGLPCSDPCLEQYIDNCPKCKEKFEANRYCKKCEMTWPKQNYICTNAQPNGELWLDGFKTAEGVIRQYLFSEETMKGVASNVIGKDRVFALGVSYFLSKKQKPIQPPPQQRFNYISTSGISSSSASNSPSKSTGVIYGQPTFFSPVNTPLNWNITKGSKSAVFGAKKRSSKGGGSSAGGSSCGYTDPSSTVDASLTFTRGLTDVSSSSCSEGSENDALGGTVMDFMTVSEVNVAKMEVSAGAKIQQKIYDDPETLDYWREQPESLIVINYGLEVDIEKILDAGKRNKKIKEEGFLQGIPVGV